MSTENVIIATATALWFAHGWYLNESLKLVHGKLDRVLEQFDGLRRYLYEIDPQFNDEREFLRRFFGAEPGLGAGMYRLELTKRKEAEGRRALNSPFA